MQSSSSMTTSNTSNFSTNTSSSFSSSVRYRKRKSMDEDDFVTKSDYKIFVTEEKLIQNMQTLSLDLSVNTLQLNSQDDEDQDQINHSSTNQLQFELHKLIKDNLRKDDLQDTFINKLYDRERKKLSMQIVPYMPIHPVQLNNNNSNKKKEDDDEENQKKILSPKPIDQIKKENNDHLFKRPFLPTPYTVEEPSETTTKRPARMKRSYSQSLRSNNNLSVVELRNDTSIYNSTTDYLIFEPTTPSVLDSSTTNHNSYNRPTIRITEYFDILSSDPSDEINIKSMIFSDTYDKMDDD